MCNLDYISQIACFAIDLHPLFQEGLLLVTRENDHTREDNPRLSTREGHPRQQTRLVTYQSIFISVSVTNFDTFYSIDIQNSHSVEGDNH